MYNTNNIKNFRIENHKSQNDIADIMQVSRSSYAMWESNNNLFPIKRLLDFCNIFKINIDYTLGLASIKKITKSYDKEKFITRFKEFRKEQNLTQGKLASILKTSESVISGYQTGRYLIATPFLYMICEKYNISADYLLGRTDTPKYLKAK